MKLRDVISQLEDFDEELTIYATPEWSPDSAAVVAREPDAGELPPEAVAGEMKYFLEVFIAKEVTEGLQELNAEAKTERLIQYAINDA